MSFKPLDLLINLGQLDVVGKDYLKVYAQSERDQLNYIGWLKRRAEAWSKEIVNVEELPESEWIRLKQESEESEQILEKEARKRKQQQKEEEKEKVASKSPLRFQESTGHYINLRV